MPLLQHTPEILHNQSFRQHLAAKIGPDNRLVFMDAQQRKTVIINREQGIEYQGLWLSNTRWFDASCFGLSLPDPVSHTAQILKKPERKFSQRFRNPKPRHFSCLPGRLGSA